MADNKIEKQQIWIFFCVIGCILFATGNRTDTRFFWQRNYHNTFYMTLERMLLFTHPVLVSVYFVATKSKKITLTNNTSLLTAVSGSVLVINLFNIDLTKTPLAGILFGLAASAAYAFYNIYADLKLKDFDPLVITSAAFGHSPYNGIHNYSAV